MVELRNQQFVDGVVSFGGKILHRQPTKMSGEPSATSGWSSLLDRESIIRRHYYHLLRENLPSFGETDGSVTIGDVATLIQNVTTGFPDSDRFIGYPFSQIPGDLRGT